MNKLIAATALSGMMAAGMATQVSAAPVQTPARTTPFQASVSGPTDLTTFTFSPTQTGNISGSVSESDPGFRITSFTFLQGSKVLEQGFVQAGGDFSFGGLNAINFTKGQKYEVQVGTSGDGFFNGSLTGFAGTLSTVPLPASVALFGGALALVGVAGLARRKSGTVGAA